MRWLLKARAHYYRHDIRKAIERYRRSQAESEKDYIHVLWRPYRHAVKEFVSANDAAGSGKGDTTMTPPLIDERELYQEMGQRIKSLRQRRGLTQLQLADRLKLTHKQYQKYEQGKCRPSLLTLLTICWELDASLPRLLPGDCIELLGAPGLTPTEVCLLNDFRRNSSSMQKAVSVIVETGAQRAGLSNEQKGDSHGTN